MLTETEKPWLFVSDVDDTLLGGDGLPALGDALRAAADRVTFAFNSSRPCASLRASLLEYPALPRPHYLIGGMGTEVEALDAPPADLSALTREVATGWERDAVERVVAPMGFEPHAAEYQTPFKLSYSVPDAAAYPRVKAALSAAGLAAKVIFSGGHNLDILPAQAGKGNIVHALARWLGIAPGHIVVAGDSGNDIEMFQPAFRGVVVGNAAPILKALTGGHIYHAQATHALGVLEGLRHWRAVL